MEGGGMNRENFYNHERYKHGLIDGKRTEGKIKKEYVDNLLQSATQNLSEEESIGYTMGWHDGFTDAVCRLLKNKVVQESYFMYEVVEL